MYEKVKNILPKKVLKKNEELLRYLLSIMYVGNTYVCNICDFKMSRFIELENNNKICPRCGSLGRTRRLWNLLESEFKLEDKKILHFSPSRGLKMKLESLDKIEYVSTDYAGEFNASKKLDIESIEEADNEFDLIICFHVLEHITQDIKAMKELFRILKLGGTCLIQTPFKLGGIYENESITTEEERLKHFGQKDHVRIYSVEGLIDRLKSVGFSTRLLEFKEKEGNINGFSESEKIIIAKKS